MAIHDKRGTGARQRRTGFLWQAEFSDGFCAQGAKCFDEAGRNGNDCAELATEGASGNGTRN